MNISRDGIQALENIHKGSKAVMELEIKASAEGPSVDTTKIRSYINRMEKAVRNHKKSLQLLRPRRQFLRTFCALMISFILLEIYILIPAGTNIGHIVVRSDWALFGFILVFCSALIIVWQILSTLIVVRDALIEKTYDNITFSSPPS